MGKEGRQASSFADFAISKFKFLRRLLFWHGSNFGFNLVNFMCLIISKAIVTGTAKLAHNIFACYSAMDFIDVYFFIAYSGLMTQYGFYVWNEQQTSVLKYSDDESKLGYTMSSNYSMVRDNFIKRVKRRFTFFAVATYWSGAWSFIVP